MLWSVLLSHRVGWINEIKYGLIAAARGAMRLYVIREASKPITMTTPMMMVKMMPSITMKMITILMMIMLTITMINNYKNDCDNDDENGDIFHSPISDIFLEKLPKKSTDNNHDRTSRHF